MSLRSCYIGLRYEQESRDVVQSGLTIVGTGCVDTPAIWQNANATTKRFCGTPPISPVFCMNFIPGTSGSHLQAHALLTNRRQGDAR
jgi:hypothetical protein